MQQVLADEYFACGYCPSRLPTSCLTTAPRFDRESIPSNFRRPLLERNDEAVLTAEDAIKDDKKIMGGPGRYALRKVEEGGELQEHDGDFFLSDLLNQLNKGMAAKPADRDIIKQEEAEDPTLVPMLWISKWVDYSDKYGLGYQLCDDSVGVLFNDTTRLIQASSGDNLQYIDRDGRELLYTLCSYPEELNKKVTLLKYFNNYMKEHLLKAGGDVARPGDDMARLPYLKTWFRTRSAIVLHLSNGTLQINFFTDHTKIIICPIMGAVTYIDESKLFKTFRMSLFEVFGCTKDIFIRLKYARNMVERLLSAKSSSKKTTQ